MDPLLPKHLMSSLAVYFEPIAAAQGISYFVEGVNEDSTDVFQTDSALLRMNGPILFEGTSTEEWYGIEIQILLTDIMQSNEPAYNIYEWSGAFQQALQNVIQIFDFDPPEELIGCLQPDRSVRNNIRVVNYNIVDRDVRVRQMSVNARYILHN